MRRDKTAEADALRRALAHHDNDWNALVHHINQVLELWGEPLISRQAVQAWLENGVPANRAAVIELATQGAVPREVVRRDLFSA